MFSFITWDVSPEIFTIFGREIRWYGLLFATGFLLGQKIFSDIYKIEGKSEKDTESLTMYMIISVVIGARLGHCLFYEPSYYLSNPIKILMIWEGGLASHGAAVGILTAIWLYSRKHPDQPYIWILDRIVILVALGGGCIRLGNLMNSEIIGLETDVPWAFIFSRVDNIPRHPAQLYEAISSFLLFGVLYLMYQKYKTELPTGRIFGIFLIVLFSLRIVYEFFKENQVAFENEIALNMGQILSIPLVLAGIVILYLSYKDPDKLKNFG